MRGFTLTLALVLFVAAGVATDNAAAWDEPIWTENGLVYPEGAEIPKLLTDVERRYLDEYPLTASTLRAGPPTGPIYCVPEYDPMEGLCIAWESYTTTLAQMAAQITNAGDADVYVVVDSTSEQTSATSTLSSFGVNMSRVKFVVRTTDTVWIRDYGPRYCYEGNCRVIVDHTYNRPRPNDNAFNSYFATVKNHELYLIPLVHGGGNYHLDALGNGYATRLINTENPGLSDTQIIGYWQDYQNLVTQLQTPYPTSVDSTQHIDMWLQVIDDHKVVISDWPANPGSTQDNICEAAAIDFASRGYTVYRVPARRVNSTHYTYTNMVMCNDIVLLPMYTNSTISPYNSQALATLQSALPTKTIIQINSDSVVLAAGVLHCIVMHVPEPIGGENPTAYLKNYRGGEILQPNTQVTINWISDDNVAVTDVDLLLSTDGGQTFPTTIVLGTADDGEYTWTVPDIYTTEARIRVVVHDGDGNTGSDESDLDLTIDGTPTCIGDLNGDNQVDLADLSQLLAAYGSCLGDANYDPAADLSNDGCVDLVDLSVMLSVYGTVCP